MNIDELTLGQIKEIQNLVGPDSAKQSQHAYEIGKIYLIRTVTMIDVGRLVQVTDQELVLEDAAWIADTGRFNDMLKGSEPNEIEPFPDGRVIIGRGAIIDCTEHGKTYRVQK